MFVSVDKGNSFFPKPEGMALCMIILYGDSVCLITLAYWLLLWLVERGSVAVHTCGMAEDGVGVGRGDPGTLQGMCPGRNADAEVGASWCDLGHTAYSWSGK